MSNKKLVESWIQRYAQRITSKPRVPAQDPEKDEGDDHDGLLVPSDFKEAFFLTGDFGRDFLKEYNGIVKRDYADNTVLQVLNWNEDDKIVKGSNPFAVVLANQILQKTGIRTATQADLEKILKRNMLPLKGQYEDSGLVWRSNAEPNEYLAKSLYNKFKQQGIDLQEGKAYVIPLFGLFIVKDASSPHKLAFKPSDPAIYFEAPILNEPSQQKFNPQDINGETGLPERVSTEGERTIYTRNWKDYTVKNSGLSRLYLSRILVLDSSSEDLADSYSSGRVVCVRGEATAPGINFQGK